MKTINRENEFARISYEEGYLHCITKSWFINFGYYYQLRHRPVEIAVPKQEIKKLVIQSTKPVVAAFIGLASVAVLAGILAKTMDGNDSGLVIGIIVALAILFLGFLYVKSKTGRLKVLACTYKGGNVALYVSTDKAELELLRKTIRDTPEMQAKK